MDCSHGKQLWELCKDKYEPLWLKGGHHCDLELFPQYLKHLRKFISAVEKLRRPNNNVTEQVNAQQPDGGAMDYNHTADDDKPRQNNNNVRLPRTRLSSDSREKSRPSIDKLKEKSRKSTDRLLKARNSTDQSERARNSFDR